MKKIRIVAVGRIKTSHWLEASRLYLQRLSRMVPVEYVEVKDGQATLPVADRMREEAGRLNKQLRPSDAVLCLDERGIQHTSTGFASMLERTQGSGKIPCFILGGAYGLDQAFKLEHPMHLALGSMTLPHELARIILLEQLYRAETIARNTGYHH